MDFAFNELAPEQLAPEKIAQPEVVTDAGGPVADAAIPDDPTNLEVVYDVPVRVKVVLGSARMEIGQLMRLKPGDIVELDRRVGEPVDIFVNDRLIAKGEIVLIGNSLGVTMTEILRQEN